MAFAILFFVPGVGVEPDLCLGALPLLYPAAPPSVFAYFIGKYTALAVALGREYVVGFWGLYCLDFFYERWRLNLCGKLIHNFCTLFSNPQLLITTFLLLEKVLYLYGYGNRFEQNYLPQNFKRWCPSGRDVALVGCP